MPKYIMIIYHQSRRATDSAILISLVLSVVKYFGGSWRYELLFICQAPATPTPLLHTSVVYLNSSYYDYTYTRYHTSESVGTTLGTRTPPDSLRGHNFCRSTLLTKRTCPTFAALLCYNKKVLPTSLECRITFFLPESP